MGLPMNNAAIAATSLALVLVLIAGCGGGSNGNLPPFGNGSNGNNPHIPGVFQPSSSFAGQCAQPRAGTSDRQGSVTSENQFLRSWTQELYLWYDEVPDLNPGDFSTLDYFDRLRTDETTASGQPKDKFHFTYDTAAWKALSQSGVEVGYGAQWILLSATPPRHVVVAYVEPNSPASAANVALGRGMEVLEVDGVDVVNDNTSTGIATLNAAFFPTRAGETHRFTVREAPNVQRSVDMTSGNIAFVPVPSVKTIDTSSGPVGYILFNDHIATSERALVDAIDMLAAQRIVDLVLDLRYNGGGFLDIASELAYMIGGEATTGRTFERIMFNDKHPSTNPITGQPLAPMPFHATTQIAAPTGRALPTLNLPRVYVLTGAGTCSASESIINALLGIDVDVYQIGSTTCGKPYGFYPHDNCGTTFFSIQFQGVNDKGLGEYSDGFSPDNTIGARGTIVPGCAVADDFTHALGDENELRLATALSFRDSNNQTCPAASGFASGMFTKPGQPLHAAEGIMLKSPLRQNRILSNVAAGS